MTNEEKARELSEKLYSGCKDYIGKRDLFSYLMSMAQWKDEQFDKKLQEIVDYVYPRILGGERLHINEIIGKDMKWQHK